LIARPSHRSRRDLISTAEERALMMGHIYIVQPLVALIAGILILIMPRLLNYVVALYLIIVGIVGLLGAFNVTG
jgi:hypothetical protein